MGYAGNEVIGIATIVTTRVSRELSVAGVFLTRDNAYGYVMPYKFGVDLALEQIRRVTTVCRTVQQSRRLIIES